MALTKISRSLLDTGVSDSSDATAITINSSENVGIGTTSPDAILETSASATGNTVGALLTNTNQSGTADSVSLNFGLGRTADSYIFSVPAIKLLKEQQFTSTGSTVDAALVFNTISNESVSESMRIDSSGYLYVGTTTRLISGTVNAENVGVANVFTAKVSNNGYFNFAGSNTSGSTTFYVQGDGDYYFAGTSQSDRDLKENIQPITESSLAKVKLLEPKTFNFKESEGYATNTKTGFVAQEVAEIFGTETGVASGTDGQKDMGIDTTGIVAHLTKAIQEQQTQIEALQSEINTLKGE